MGLGFDKKLPDAFVKNVIDLCGQEGLDWIESLPRIVSELEDLWGISIESHFQNLSYNYVAEGNSVDRNKRVLKIALPLRNPEIFDEAKALKAFEGCGAVRIYEKDFDRRAILIEHLLPGTNLKELFSTNKDRAIDISIKVLKRIQRVRFRSVELPDLTDWFAAFDRAKETDFPRHYLRRAAELLSRLESAASKRSLLHGDFHHENILLADDNEFKIIDPKGVIGNLGYEISVFLNNHLEWIEHKKDIDGAVEKFSRAFEISPQKLKHWAYVQRVLSVCWGIEDSSGDWNKHLKQANIWIA
ncbi:MAG: phosphotransferase [Pyrinomonadaceae bacterium]|nr:phosphotransferase [Pyrinomonadaceae bacterium]